MTKFFNFLASPDIAMLLVMAGMLGLYVEFQQPGMLVPGIPRSVLSGARRLCVPDPAVFLDRIARHARGDGLTRTRNLRYVVWSAIYAGPHLCSRWGTMIFDMPEVSDLTVSFWSVLVPLVTGFAIVGGVVVLLVTRSIFRSQTAGVDELLGLVGEARTAAQHPEGKVFIRANTGPPRPIRRSRAANPWR